MQLPHCQTQAYDCVRGKTRLGGGATPKIGGGGNCPPLPHAGYGPDMITTRLLNLTALTTHDWLRVLVYS